MTDPADQAPATELARYDAARRALEAAAAVDEVLEIKNEAVAWAAYARQAKDRELEIKATHIRFRAERRLGELILAQKATVGLAKGGQPYQAAPDPTCAETEQVERRPPTLAEAGIDRKLSSRAQKIALLGNEKFEELLDKHREEVAGGAAKVSADLLRVNSEEEGRASRRDLAAELSRKSAELSPTGKRYPLIYADPPWKRKQGINSRSYENHYATMDWAAICAMPVKERALPDAWLALWIPRAHMFARIEIEIEVTIAETGERVLALVELPLADAIARSWGFDEYSTAWVWTKTDEDHPDESGSGIIAFDQDEILLLFKRGRGLPKPAACEKYGSNHRERSRPLGHSTKPQHYRRMLADMIGCDRSGEPLPALELFARHDPDRPLPKNWDVWGNQAEADPAPAEPAIDQAPAADDLLGSDLAAFYAEPEAAPAPIAEPAELEAPPGGFDYNCFDNRCMTPADCLMSGCERRNEIAADVSSSHVEQPAPPESPANSPVRLPPQDVGKVEASAGSTEADPAATAVPPADRPGSLFGDELELPAILRRKPAAPPAPIVQRELDLARIDRADPEIVDGALQTRLPLTPDELELQAGLLAYVNGNPEACAWHVTRQLVSLRYLIVPVSVDKPIKVSDEGLEWLAQLVTPPAPATPQLEASAS